MPMQPPTHNPYPGLKRARRKKISDPFYMRARWRRVRLMVLRRQPLCADPMDRHLGQPVPATEVDHIVPRLEAPGLAYTLSNLRGLCRPCHSAITMLATHAKRRAT